MTAWLLEIAGRSYRVTRASGHEALDGTNLVTVEVELDAPLPARIVGEAAAIAIANPFGERIVAGVVARTTRHATSARGRRASIVVRSAIHRLELARRSRVFQHDTGAAIVAKLLAEHGITTRFELGRAAVPRDYVVQYDERDFDFVRRLAEEEGFHLRIVFEEGREVVVIADTSSAAPSLGSLRIADPGGLAADEPAAWSFRTTRRRRAGKVVAADHDHEHPAVALQAEAKAQGIEESLALFVAPGRFETPAAGSQRAALALEVERADATVHSFDASAVGLNPGHLIALDADAPELGPSEEVFVTSVDWRFDREKDFALSATAIAKGVPYRLRRTTLSPRIDGVHLAIVTGAPGEEIHVDELGRVRVRFFWDREGPRDAGSSLPVRVLQPNLPGALLTPRVGWEVLVAFEDGDPDRPYVLGRVYNEKQKPPFSLPGNKTLTALGTMSSPGGGRENRIHFDDAAGRQHFAIHAGFGKSTRVGADQKLQTKGSEAWSVGGAQTVAVGGNDTLSIKTAYIVGAASQTEKIGGDLDVTVGTAQQTKTGSETISVGSALFEKVGNPADGIGAAATAFALHEFGETFGGVAGALGGIVAAAAQGLHDGGLKGMGLAAGKSAIDTAIGLTHIPGLDALSAAADGTGKMPWAPDPDEDDDSKAAGGPSAAAAEPGAAGGPGGAGHRVIKAGSMVEMIGATSLSAAPASIRWTTAGAQIIALGGSHNVKAIKVHTRVAGAQVDTAPELAINCAGLLIREAKGALSRNVAGAASYRAGAAFNLLSGGDLSLTVGGPLTFEGSNVTFVCGGSSVAVSSGGLLVKASTVSFESPAETGAKEAAP